MVGSDSADRGGCRVEICQAASELVETINPCSADVPDISAREKNFAEVWSLAHRTKTSGFLAAALQRRSPAVSEELRREAGKVRQVILLRNLSNLETACNVARAFDRDGIEVVFFKGILQSHDTYGAWDIRPANDLDVLVRHSDYRKACDVLLRNSFRAGVRADSRWWHEYLGESPFLPSTGNGVTVDLHHRLTQPGMPVPQHPNRFFETARQIALRGQDLPLLSRPYAVLILAINLCKGLRNQETWLAYAHEIATILSRSDAAQKASFAEAAREQGLTQILDDTVNLTEQLFEHELKFGSRARSLPIRSDRNKLLLSAIGQPDESAMPLRRLRLQWRWTEGGCPSRALSFASGAWRAEVSEIHRLREYGFFRSGKGAQALPSEAYVKP